MPDLEDWDLRLATSSLAALGFSEETGNLVIRREYSEDYEKGHVISTVPSKDTDLTDVAQVTLVVSDGEEEPPVAVISFLDMTEEAARTAATDLGLNPVFEGSEYSDEYEEGDVCWQSIANGTQVARGTTIRFRLSLGPDPAATPSPSARAAKTARLSLVFPVSMWLMWVTEMPTRSASASWERSWARRNARTRCPIL